jgi:type IV pilus assembly protein PilB
MTPGRKDFTDILLRRRSLGPAQLAEARRHQRQTGVPLPEALVNLGYATARQVLSALAQHHGLKFIDLTRATVPPRTIELVPEAVARENVILPLMEDGQGLKIAVSDPGDFGTVQKLQFLLNKNIQPVLAHRAHLIAAINRYYPGADAGSEDAVPQEFINTPIDFTKLGPDPDEP